MKIDELKNDVVEIENEFALIQSCVTPRTLEAIINLKNHFNQVLSAEWPGYKKVPEQKKIYLPKGKVHISSSDAIRAIGFNEAIDLCLAAKLKSAAQSDERWPNIKELGDIIYRTDSTTYKKCIQIAKYIDSIYRRGK
jgi:hypothetical protein